VNTPLPVSPYTAGLRGRCPRCGEGRLFKGYLDLAPRCERCALDYSFADAGDGPAVFVILIAGFAVVGSAPRVEAFWPPPYWLPAVLWLPLLWVLTLGRLRPLLGLLVTLQYHHTAVVGRADGGAPGA
jgi:uncharacterized protein (DUF983 family)